MDPTKKKRERSEYGQRMADAREAAGLTQEQVRAKLHIPQSTLATIEKGATGSSFTAQLARLYGKDAYWLATGEGSPDPIVLTDDERALILTLRARKVAEPAVQPKLVPPNVARIPEPRAGGLTRNKLNPKRPATRKTKRK